MAEPSPTTRLLVVTLGATALQAYDASTGGMRLAVPPQQLLAQAEAGLVPADRPAEALSTELLALPCRSGAELTLATLCTVRQAVLGALGRVERRCAAAVLLCGTDTLEEAAFVLHLMLGTALLRHGTVLCVTGAMLPADQLGADGQTNLRDALRVLVVMNNVIHLAQHVRKADSQLPGAFHSHPGPLGELRGGRAVLCYAPLPPGSAAAAWLPRDEFEHTPAEALAKQRVAIWTLTIDGWAPPEALLEQLDGLVLAGSGTGSLPGAVTEKLAPAWTARLPCVIASRCSWGANHDDFYYRGSREKYESRGFVLGGGYERLNPVQARCLLALRLAASGHA